MSWSDFAKNFNDVYGAFNNTFKNIKAAEISDWEVEDEMVEGVRTGNKLYGGQVLKPDYQQRDLDQIQYKALGDLMTKYGDAAGGLKMKLDANTLRGAESDVRVKEGTEETRVAQEKANLEGKVLNNKGQVIQNKGYVLDNEGKRLANQGMVEDNYTKMMSNEEAAMKLEQDKLFNEGLTAWQQNVRDGMYENEDEKYQGFLGFVKDINPTLGVELEEKYSKADLQKMLTKASKTSQEVNDVLINGYKDTVGINAVKAYIDDRNGDKIDVDYRPREGGGFELVAMDKGGTVLQTIASGKTEQDVLNGVIYYATPSGSIGLEKDYVDQQLKLSQIKKNNQSGGLGETLKDFTTAALPYSTDQASFIDNVRNQYNAYKEVLGGLRNNGNDEEEFNRLSPNVQIRTRP